VENGQLRFHGGVSGALAPFAVFLVGVGWLGLSGAPDERGFWPVLLAACLVGIVLAQDRHAYAESYLAGMSQKIVATMVVAWLLAGVLGSLLGASELVPALTSLVARAGVDGGGYVVAAFLVCCLVSTGTGTSLGTILIAGPLLYPAGAALGASPAMLIWAILGGATFGDNISPVSDTTIASATSQGAAMGEVVKSRLAYALPAALIAVVGYAVFGGGAVGAGSDDLPESASPLPLLMLLAPAVSIGLLLSRRHLVEGLLGGCVCALVVGLAAGLFEPAELMFIDRESHLARGLILTGMERAVGVSIFTLLLMGLVAPIQASGLLDRWLASTSKGDRTRRGAELTIFGAVSAACILTTHSAVAILATGQVARELGEAHDIARTRSANLLDVTVCTYPFLLPFFIPTILASTTTLTGGEAGMPHVTAFAAGLHNFHSWGLLGVLVLSMVVGSRR